MQTLGEFASHNRVADKMCIENVCLTSGQLKNLLELQSKLTTRMNEQIAATEDTCKKKLDDMYNTSVKYVDTEVQNA